MSTFFSWMSDIFTFINSWNIIGNISLLHILLTCLVIGVVAKLIKGKN